MMAALEFELPSYSSQAARKINSMLFDDIGSIANGNFSVSVVFSVKQIFANSAGERYLELVVTRCLI